MSDRSPPVGSPADRLAQLQAAAAAVERLAADYHAAIQPVQFALQAVADSSFDDPSQWSTIVSVLAGRLRDAGMADVLAGYPVAERWDRQFDAGKVGHALAGQAFFADLTAALAGGSPPHQFFDALGRHPSVRPVARQEVCAGLSHLLHLLKERVAPGFMREYGRLLAAVGMDGDTLAVRLARCDIHLSAEVRAAIYDWDECASGAPFYAATITPALPDATPQPTGQGQEGEPSTAPSSGVSGVMERLPTCKIPGVVSLNVLRAYLEGMSTPGWRERYESWPEVPFLRLRCAELFPGQPFTTGMIELLIAWFQQRGLSPAEARHLPLEEAVRWLHATAATPVREPPETGQFARFLQLHALVESKEDHDVPLAALDEYQRLLTKFGVYCVDGVGVGPPDPTRMPRTDPILNTDCIPIPGATPRVCPRSQPRLPVELLPGVEKTFRNLRLVGADQTVLWVGRQANMSTICTYRNGCTCFPKEPPPRPAVAAANDAVAVLTRGTSKRGGRPRLTASKKPADRAKVTVYEMVRAVKNANPAIGEKQLLNHFKKSKDFKDSARDAGLEFGEELFRAALAWIASNPVGQETRSENLS